MRDEKDMSLIMNGTQEMWTKEFAEAYSEIHINMAEGYLNQGDRDFKRKLYLLKKKLRYYKEYKNAYWKVD